METTKKSVTSLQAPDPVVATVRVIVEIGLPVVSASEGSNTEARVVREEKVPVPEDDQA